MLNYLYRYFLRFYIKYQFYIHIIFYILYLRRVTTKIAKVHLENLEIISTVQKSVDKHVYLASFV